MGRDKYIYYRQSDFRGGINEFPANAEANQVASARNVWAPRGVLEQRPGYEGINAYGTLVGGSPTIFVARSETAAGVFASPAGGGTLDLGGLVGRQNDGNTPARWYIGHSATFPALSLRVAVVNTAAVDFEAEYWNGAAWMPLSIIERVSSATQSCVTPHLGVNPTIFSWAIPKDWTLKTVNSQSAYWIRFNLVNATVSAGTQIDVDNGSTGAFTISYGASIFMAQFPSTKRFVEIHAGGAAVTSAASLFNHDRVNILVSNALSISELASFVVVPQFMELYAAQNNTILVSKAFPAATDNVIAAVETDPVWVGTVAGIKSTYHPDFIPQLGEFPRANYVEFFHGQLWAASILDAPYRVQWSAPQPAYKVWPNESYEEIMEDDNSPITGMRAFGEHLAIFKQDSIWRMVHTGQSSTQGDLNTYAPVKMAPGSGVGCVSNSSVVEINGMLVFLAEDGVYSFNGVEISKLSSAIDDTMRRITPGLRKWSVGCHWRKFNCYLLAVSLDGASKNDHVLVYDYVHGAWWIWDAIEVINWLVDEGEYDEQTIYFGDSTGGLYQLGVGDTDHGATITSYVILHRIGDEDNNVRFTKELREISVRAENIDVSSLSVGTYVEDADALTTATADYTDANDPLGADAAIIGTVVATQEKQRLVSVPFRSAGNWFQTKITNSTRNTPMKVWSVEHGVWPLGRR